jgi:glutamate-1-semialdehyde 2,1-aminomutase
MKVLAIAQGRMGSTRVPGKVMRRMGEYNLPVLHWVYDALIQAEGIDQAVIATSTLSEDNIIAGYCRDTATPFFRGSEADVLDRFYQCALRYDADIVLRLTCDCPFLDPQVIGEVVKLRSLTNADYASNIDPPSYPDGLDVECFTFKALKAAWEEATRSTDRDCVTQFIVRNRHRFNAVNLRCPLPGLDKERWVLDTEADWDFCQAVAEHVRCGGQPYLKILNILDEHPEIRKLNPGIRNERFFEAINTERLPPRTFERTAGVFKRAIKTIPFGAQTFSKSHLQFPSGRSPLYCSHADGARIFDVDGNDYVDLVNAVLPVVLGYRDPDVDEAVRQQLDRGISFSLATELEAELSETLCRLIPCAQAVKLGKSGTDVTTAAIRLARAYTGKSHILLSGYHGWADWSMAASQRDAGIPLATKLLSHKFEYGNYNDEELNRWIGDAAAIIVEPDSNPEYLKFLREACDEHNVVLIFDEIITGFRYHIGGAQAYWNVTPDLATFGKAMANGMPISALVGKRDIMARMSPPNNIFYSGTMFGETLSIAAAIATIKKLEKEDVPGYLWHVGAELMGHVTQAIEAHGLEKVISLSGMAPRVAINIQDHKNATKEEIKALFMQEMIQGGVLVIASHNVSYAIKQNEVKRILTAYNRALTTINQALEDNNISDYIEAPLTGVAPLRTTA